MILRICGAAACGLLLIFCLFESLFHIESRKKFAAYAWYGASLLFALALNAVVHA